ncbi:MAG: DNA translocase FtsK [Paracoccaceae bacterium]
MASYQAKQRNPLFDSNTQAVLERRSKELIGVVLLVGALLTAMILWSYVPEDPSWLSATDEPIRNMLGRIGATIASPLIVIAGVGAWGVALVFGVWGMRFLLHTGEERAITRVIFAPIAIALASVYASTHVPGPNWTHSFGLGGLFGDTVLGAVLGVVPVKATIGLKVMAFFMAIGAFSMAAFVLGVTRDEVKTFSRFLLVGIVRVYAAIIGMLAKAGRGMLNFSKSAVDRNAERRATKSLAAEAANTAVVDTETQFQQPVVRRANLDLPMGTGIHRAEPRLSAIKPTTEIEPEAKPGILSRIPSLLKRTPEPVEEPLLHTDEDFGDPAVKAMIADVIRKRVLQKPILRADVTRPEPSVSGDNKIGSQRTTGLQIHDRVLDRNDEIENEYVDPSAQLGSEPEPEMYQASGVPLPDPKKVVQHAPRKTVKYSRQAKAEAQPSLQFEDKTSEYSIPPLNLLSNAIESEQVQLTDEALEENARMLESVLDDYGVKGEIISVRPGPVVTMYELEPAPGLKASRVIGLADDIARSMSALSARVSTVPGRSVIGIELPNEHREKVILREILAARDFGDSNIRLPLALGKDIGGDPVIANLAKMPHLLIAGTTGSGKSVAINTMILSLLYKLTPEDCRMIMIDPKMLELSVYDGIPHLLSPVVTDPKKAVVALKWVVAEMEERYRKMSKMGVRNIEGYNGRVRAALDKNELFKRTVQTGFDEGTGEPIFETEEFQPKKIPYIVVIVDEMADLMMVAGKEIEACIQRLAQMARASGIHLIMATQRPSVDVITGTIKANFPTRISFQVTSKIDSRTILGEQGAEQLLGMGDMLYLAGGAKITRVHGPFVSDEEVEEIVNYLKSFGPPEYLSGVTDGPDEDTENSIDLVLGLGGNTDGNDALYDEAVAIVARDRKCSTSYIQRKLAIGYNKAARLVEQMEDSGLVSSANHVGKREILIPEQQ